MYFSRILPLVLLMSCAFNPKNNYSRMPSSHSAISQNCQVFLDEMFFKDKKLVFGPDKRELIDQLISSAESVGLASELKSLFLNSKSKTVLRYLHLLELKTITNDDLLLFLADQNLEKVLPLFSNSGDEELFIKMLKGHYDYRIKSFAYFNWQKIKGTNPLLSQKLKAISQAKEVDLKLETQGDGTVSILWFPHYPDGASFTHNKLVVDGQVWGTMVEFKKMKEIKVHERLAESNLRHNFFEFKLSPTPEELDRIKYLLENNDRRGTGIGMCVQGACGALGESGIIHVPFPFNQIPSLAALYFSLRRVIPGGVTKIQFRGKNPVRALMSFDIVHDGLPIGLITMLGGGITAVVWGSNQKDK